MIESCYDVLLMLVIESCYDVLLMLVIELVTVVVVLGSRDWWKLIRSGIAEIRSGERVFCQFS